jgi:hypothetical protein
VARCRGIFHSLQKCPNRKSDTVRHSHCTPKAEFLRDFPAEARAAADLLGVDVKSLTFDLASVSSDPSVTIRFRTRVGNRAVWVKVAREGDSLVAQMVLEQMG